MAESSDDPYGRSAYAVITLDDLWREYGDRWDITVVTGGYRALIRDAGMRGTVPLYGRTPAELAESLQMAECQP